MLATVLGTADPTGGPAWGLTWGGAGKPEEKQAEGKSRSLQKEGWARMVNEARRGCWRRGGGFYFCIQWPHGSHSMMTFVVQRQVPLRQ